MAITLPDSGSGSQKSRLMKLHSVDSSEGDVGSCMLDVVEMRVCDKCGTMLGALEDENGSPGLSAFIRAERCIIGNHCTLDPASCCSAVITFSDQIRKFVKALSSTGFENEIHYVLSANHEAVCNNVSV